VVATCSWCFESSDFIRICFLDCGLTGSLYLSRRLRYRPFKEVFLHNPKQTLWYSFQVPSCTSRFMCSPSFVFNFIRIKTLSGRATELSLQILQFTVSHKIKTPRRLSEATTYHLLSEGWTGKCRVLSFTRPSQKSGCHINLAFPLSFPHVWNSSDMWMLDHADNFKQWGSAIVSVGYQLPLQSRS
jgi:hypothetical protein